MLREPSAIVVKNTIKVLKLKSKKPLPSVRVFTIMLASQIKTVMCFLTRRSQKSRAPPTRRTATSG